MRLQTGLSGQYGDDRRPSSDFRLPPYTPSLGLAPGRGFVMLSALL